MEYPDWLVKSLIQFNHNATCMNEWELMDLNAIDLHRQPDLPQRLEVLFKSLQEGFGRDTLVAGNFLALEYDTESDVVSPRFIEFGKNAPSMMELNKWSEEAAVHAFEHAFGEAKKAARDAPQRTALVIQVPYFIRKVNMYAPNNGIDFQSFQQLFNKKQVVFSSTFKVKSAEEVERWFGGHYAEWYEQRFLFTLGLVVDEAISSEFTKPEIAEAVGYFMGSFLTWAGMGVADSTRYVMAAAAARLAHYSHEFLKPWGVLQDFINKHGDLVPAELHAVLDPVMERVKLIELSNISAGLGSDRFSFNALLLGALKQNTDISLDQQTIADGTYDLTLDIRDVTGRKLRLTIDGLPDDSVKIRFDNTFFHRLIRNLLRNAAQHSKDPQSLVEVLLRVEPNLEYKFLTMRFKHVGSTIKREVMRLLFRMPIPHNLSSGHTGNLVLTPSKGIGLWTVGMAFEAQRLPLPVVEQDKAGAGKGGVSFIFRFPID